MRATPPPRPGAVHGLYPQRPDGALSVRLGLRNAPGAALMARRRASQALPRIRANQAIWAGLDGKLMHAHLQRLRALMARHGWQHHHLRAQALGAAAAAMQRALGRNPYDTQLLCAQLLLQGHLAEMSTGEGKTLAVALAAAVAALAGVPVHVMTANDYLVARDAEQLAPYFAALGLRNGAVCAAHSAEERRAAHACDVTHSTARELAFDHLRDRELLRAQPTELQQRAARLCQPSAATPLLRGLCMALVDEADSLLIDEATLPLVLAESVDDPAHRARCVQALSLARALRPGQQVHVQMPGQQVQWTEQALRVIETLSTGWGAPWDNAAQRQDLVGQALVALHGLQRDVHYLVRTPEAMPATPAPQAAAAAARGARVELLDAHTGRAAQGRVWSRELQTLVELKEGCSTSPANRTCAQTSYQRFFRRYLHLAGTSGTLVESRRELAAVYGLQVVRVPLRSPSRLALLPARHFADAQQREQAVAQRVRQLVALGRPVLIGVATVAQAQSMARRLAGAGITHQVLDARHDADEARIVAQAGQRATVTVATAMAGRGTDITLGPGVANAGGLHVLLCQDNRCKRLDRQLMGRAGRQGDPGSAEIWGAADAAAVVSAAADTAKTPATRAAPWAAAVRHAWQRATFETREMQRRRRLLEQDLQWEQRLSFTQLHA